MGVVEIYIHNFKNLQGNTSSKWTNPFTKFSIGKVPMSSIVKCYDPTTFPPNKEVQNVLKKLVEDAINIRNNY